MRLQEQQAAFARDVARLINWIGDNGFTVTFGETFRTPEQAEIYAREGKGIKDSLHCKRLAVDLNLFDHEGHFLQEKKDYQEFGIFWEGLSPLNRWGGNFPRVDCVHFERREQE